MFIFVIPDVTDMSTDKTFTTKKGTYKLQVGQMERANGPEPFSMTLSIH